MKIVVAQHNVKFMTLAPVEILCFYHVYYMNFNKAACRKKYFHHVVLTLIGLGFFDMFRFGGRGGGAADAAPYCLRCLWTYRNEILYSD